MDLKQRLEFCKKCSNRKFSNVGIICSITESKPAFIGECKDFNLDPVEEQKILAKANYSDNEDDSKTSIWSYVVIALIIIKIILRFVRN